MCKFCVGMLTGVVVCLASLGVGLTLLHSGTISLGSTASASKDDPEPIPELADPVPVPVPSDPAPIQTPVGSMPSCVDPSPVAVVVAPEELIPPPAPETDLASAAPQLAVPPAPPEPLMPRASDDTTIAPAPPVLAQPVSAPASMPATLAVRSTTAPREPALFLGSHSCTLDEERRLKLPAGVREHWGEVQTFCLTLGPNRCLVVSSEAAVESLLEQKLQTSHLDRVATRRIHFACTKRVKIDADGNCCVPESLAKLAGLTREIVLIGVGTHVEIWDAQVWQKYLEQELGASSSGTGTSTTIGRWAQ